MLGELLRRRCEAVNLIPVKRIRNAFHCGNLRYTAGHRAGFVKGDDLHPCKSLQCISLTNQKAVLCGVSDRRHDRRRCRKNQCAGTEHNQNRHRADQLSGYPPGQYRSRKRNHHDPGCPPVRKTDNPGLAGIRRLHQTYHPLDGAVFPHSRGLHLKCAELVDRTAGYLIARRLVHRKGFTGHHRLIDGGLTGENDPVHRDTLAGEHADTISDSDFLRRYDLLFPVPQNARGLRRQMYQLLNSCPRSCHRQLLEQGAQLHDHRHLARSKNFPDADGSDQRQRHQHICLDVEGRDQSDKGLQKDGHPAQDNRNPCHIKRERFPFQQTADHRSARNDQQRRVLCGSSELQQRFQLLHCMLHRRVSFLYLCTTFLYP